MLFDVEWDVPLAYISQYPKLPDPTAIHKRRCQAGERNYSPVSPSRSAEPRYVTGCAKRGCSPTGTFATYTRVYWLT